jgi:hypothetical protein
MGLPQKVKIRKSKKRRFTMLGEQIGEERGKITTTRVMPNGGDRARVEVSFQASGKILGLEHTDMGTYMSTVRPDGTLFGEGQGVCMTKDGSTASWVGSGIGRFTGQGSGVSWRGALFYRTDARNLARLNNIAVVFEYETDENGNAHTKIWEWK